jgi:hypothetical protein
MVSSRVQNSTCTLPDTCRRSWCPFRYAARGKSYSTPVPPPGRTCDADHNVPLIKVGRDNWINMQWLRGRQWDEETSPSQRSGEQHAEVLVNVCSIGVSFSWSSE